MRAACRTRSRVAKMRAASNFSRVRLFVDSSTRTHHIETLDKTVTPAHWTTEGGSTALSTGVSFSFGVVATPPPNTQAMIGQAPPCTTTRARRSPIPPASCSTRAACRSIASFAPTGDRRVLRDRRHGRLRGDGRRDRNGAAVAHAARRDADLGAQLIDVASGRSAARRSSRLRSRPAILLVVMVGLLGDGGACDDVHREPRTPRGAHHRVRAGQDGAAAGDRIHRPGRQYRHISGHIRPAALGWRLVAVSTRPLRSMATSIGSLRTADLLGGGRHAARDWFYERVWQITQAASRASSRSASTATVRSSVGQRAGSQVDRRRAEERRSSRTPMTTMPLGIRLFARRAARRDGRSCCRVEHRHERAAADDAARRRRSGIGPRCTAASAARPSCCSRKWGRRDASALPGTPGALASSS